MSFKRRDASETPLQFQSSLSRLETDLLITSGTPLKRPPPDAGHKLLIVNTDSDLILHDTGSHQENRLRTELLSGPSGCLRRLPLQPYVEWEDESNIVNAALVDLLR
jgi:hypothetical protein